MQERHSNRLLYFNEQAETTRKYVIPFAQDFIEFDKNTRVLEIGCGEGGNLIPFADMGCQIVGVDMNETKIKNAKSFFSSHSNINNIEFILADIYDSNNLGEFDFIFMRDVLEHIHNQEKFMEFVKRFLKPNGLFFLGFPPFQNPFGGHQQTCKSKVLSRTPYYHILPTSIYKKILNSFSESDTQIRSQLEVKETGISIERFERIIKKSNYDIKRRIFYFINPNYEIKFGLKPRKQLSFLTAIPYFRNFIITTNYYLLSLKKK